MWELRYIKRAYLSVSSPKPAPTGCRVADHIMFFMLVAAVISANVALFAYYVAPIVWSTIVSPLRHLPGPPNDSFFWGNAKLIKEVDESVLQDQWVARYGSTIAYRGIFRVRTVVWKMNGAAQYSCTFDRYGVYGLWTLGDLEAL